MRPVYETAQPLFSVHHVNAWEADSCTIVVDTLARDTAHFAASDFTSLSSFETPEEATTMRRLVMRGTALDCRQFDTRTVTGLEGRSFNFPSLLPPKCTGQPHQAVFVVVRCIHLLCCFLLCDTFLSHVEQQHVQYNSFSWRVCGTTQRNIVAS